MFKIFVDQVPVDIYINKNYYIYVSENVFNIRVSKKVIPVFSVK